MTRANLASLAAGAIFGVGLALSAMVDRHVVLGFLDVTGHWNPRLAFVMAAAVAVAAVAYCLIFKRPAPALGGEFRVPKTDVIDVRLVAGAAIFGVGWGLAGFCPGPVLVGVAAGVRDAWIFVPAMFAGSWIAGRLVR